MKSNWISWFGLPAVGKKNFSDIGICGLDDLPAILRGIHSLHLFCTSFVNFSHQKGFAAADILLTAGLPLCSKVMIVLLSVIVLFWYLIKGFSCYANQCFQKLLVVGCFPAIVFRSVVNFCSIWRIVSSRSHSLLVCILLAFPMLIYLTPDAPRYRLKLIAGTAIVFRTG